MKHSGTKDLPGPAHSLKDNIAHKESPASGGPDSRDHSTAKSSRGVDSSIAHSSTHRTAHKSNPASGGPDLRDRSTAHPSGSSNPSDKTEGAFTKGHHPPRHTSDHSPTTPSRLTPHTQLEWLDSRLPPPHQRKRLRTLKEKRSVKSKDSPPETPSYSETRENPSPIPPPSEDTDSEPTSEHSELISLPFSPRSPTSPDLTTPRSFSPDRTISPTLTMGTVKDLAKALTEKLKDIGRHPTIPLPQFRGKKGEDPNDHCMKVEDYFAMFDIECDEDQKKRFLETLFEKARRWASTINIDELDGYKYDDKYTKEQKEKSFKWLFLKRFTKEGRTINAAFEAWSFDPAKDEVEKFMTSVKNLAATLEFNEEAQIMAIKSNMPGMCMVCACSMTN